MNEKNGWTLPDGWEFAAVILGIMLFFYLIGIGWIK